MLEYFVLKITVRSAANMFYTKVRLLIAKRLTLDAQQRFDGNIEP